MKTLLQRLFPKRAEQLRTRLEDVKEKGRQARAKAAEAQRRCQTATGVWRPHWQSQLEGAERAINYCKREEGRLLWLLSFA